MSKEFTYTQYCAEMYSCFHLDPLSWLEYEFEFSAMDLSEEEFLDRMPEYIEQAERQDNRIIPASPEDLNAYRYLLEKDLWVEYRLRVIQRKLESLSPE